MATSFFVPNIRRKLIADLLAWYSGHKRALPWRQTTDAYLIYLSEVVMQQTRVDQGTAYWHRLLERFPTVVHLAQAPIDDVLKLWEGLGYYSRAHNLHRAAQAVVERHGGQFPPTVEALQALPGVGPYTARAVASFAFGAPVAVLDGNVYRVLSRLAADPTPIDLPGARARFQAMADELLAACPRGGADSPDFNSALMDLGAAVCTPRQPRCGQCPLHEGCAAGRAGTAQQYPLKAKKMARSLRRFDVLYIHDPQTGGMVVRRRPDGGFWRGLYELPTTELAPDADFDAAADELVILPHAFTHFELQIRFRRVAPQAYALQPGDRWALPGDRATLAFPRPYNRFFEWLEHHTLPGNNRGLFG